MFSRPTTRPDVDDFVVVGVGEEYWGGPGLLSVAHAGRGVLFGPLRDDYRGRHPTASFLQPGQAVQLRRGEDGGDGRSKASADADQEDRFRRNQERLLPDYFENRINTLSEAGSLEFGPVPPESSSGQTSNRWDISVSNLSDRIKEALGEHPNGQWVGAPEACWAGWLARMPRSRGTGLRTLRTRCPWRRGR